MSDSDYGYSEDQGTWVGGGDSGGYWEPTPAPPPATVYDAPVFNDPAPIGALSAPALAPSSDINALYQEYLGRAPDPTGIAANQGATAEQIRQSILASPEYAARSGSSAPLTSIYQELLGRDPDASGIASFSNLAPDQVRAAIMASPEFQQRNTEWISTTDPYGMPISYQNPNYVSTPASFTPYNLDQYGYSTDQETQYYNAAKLANWQMERGRPDLAQQYIEQANALKKELDSPYRIDTISSGGAGDSGSGTNESFLVDKSGSIISAVSPQEGGKYVVTSPGTGDSGAATSGNAFTIDDLIKEATSAAKTPFGVGRGQAVGYAYELKNAEGDPYQRYDAKGNLTEFVNRLTGEWTKASDVKPIGTVFDPEQGKFVTQYQYGDNKFTSTVGSGGSTFAPIMDPYKKDTSGFLGEGGWSKIGALVAAGLTAGIASGAIMPGAAAAAPGSATAIGSSAAKGALTGIAASGFQGAKPADMLKAGILGGVAAGLSELSALAGEAGLGGALSEAPSSISAPSAISDVIAPTADDYLNALVEGYQNSNIQPIPGSETVSATISDIDPSTFTKSLPSPSEANVGADVISDSAQDLLDKISNYTDIPAESVVLPSEVQNLIDRGFSPEDIVSNINRLLEIKPNDGISTPPSIIEPPFSPPAPTEPPLSPPSPIQSPIESPVETPIEAPLFPGIDDLLEIADEGEEEDDESKRRKKKRKALDYYLLGKGAQDTGYGALPGNLQGTFLQGVNVNEYNPFEGYNLYQHLQPVRAAQGGSPLQLAQMQQSVYGVDPALYSVLQKRQSPNYFTYGADTSGGNPTTFSGSQLMGKPSPIIPVIPTGKPPGGDWLYQGSGSNPLAMAGTGLPTLPGGMMAEGGQAHGGEGEHIPEFITGATGHYVKGRGDGQSDDIPAMLADGEYVFDAETVAQLGNGSSDAGAAVLDKMREAIRGHKRSAPVDEIPPKSKSPLEYLAEATKGKGK